jgi:3-deoxy-manno-octulosonate cytidylyltransferase (CMP-KDO synthetase)
MKVIGVIPARYASTRLPGKPLADILGKPLIQYVYEAAITSRLLNSVLIATDDARIYQAVTRFGGQVCMTSPAHSTGTDRVAEAALKSEADLIVNIQGDEPLLPPEMIDEVVQPFLEEPDLPMSTLCTPIHAEADLLNPNVVKVVFDQRGNALYFSRSLIPYPRKANGHLAYEHIGLYAYTQDFLQAYVRLPQTSLEITESLEQLRALESGYRIKVVTTHITYAGPSVDTLEDLEEVRQIVAKRMHG